MAGLFSFFRSKRPAKPKAVKGSGLAVDPRLDLPKRGSSLDYSGLESIIDDNDMRRVNDVRIQPWRQLCCLDIHRSNGGRSIGTGLLIAPDIVLTAAHNLYALKDRSYAIGIEVEAGMDAGAAAATSRIDHIQICQGYDKYAPSDEGQYAVDYGIIRLADESVFNWVGRATDVLGSKPFSDEELTTTNLSIAGYPAADKVPPILMRHHGGPTQAQIGPTVFSYTIDTLPGQSGAPVFGWDADTETIRLAGVHVAGGDRANRARRFTPEMQAQVAKWIASLSRA